MILALPFATYQDCDVPSAPKTQNGKPYLLSARIRKRGIRQKSIKSDPYQNFPLCLTPMLIYARSSKPFAIQCNVFGICLSLLGTVIRRLCLSIAFMSLRDLGLRLLLVHFTSRF